MVELVVLACLLATPDYCEEFHLPFLRPMAMGECLVQSSTVQVVQWANEHPSWTIKKWTCGAPRA